MSAAPFLIVLALVANSRAQIGETYNAAVVEFSPAIQNLMSNVEEFTARIAEAANNDTDIIVFPEIGLLGYDAKMEGMYTKVPHPREGIAPLNGGQGFSDALQKLSQAAKDSGIYVVVNLVERVECSPSDDETCPGSLEYLYNTNVAFDRSGTVVARYRKFHLFGEADKSITKEPELSFFDTDFGVRFGMFICFDLMFDRPALQLIKQLDIHDVVFSTAWFSELPFLTATQAQAMWSHATDTNFLASGYSLPEVGSGGSGIYEGRKGAQVVIFPETNTKETVYGTVMKKEDKRRISTYKSLPAHTAAPGAQRITPDTQMRQAKETGAYLKRDKIDIYASKILEEDTVTDLCYDDFCCHFDVAFKKTDGDASFYRAFAFDGVRTFDGVATGGVQTCAIVACGNDTVESCGTRVESLILFSKIEISGNFTAKNSLPMASTVNNDLLPVSVETFSFNSACHNDYCNIIMNTLGNQERLLTFGIYSRVFSRDGQEESAGSLANACLSLFISTLTLLTLLN